MPIKRGAPSGTSLSGILEVTNKLGELIAELSQMEPGQQIRKHESIVAEAVADSLRAARSASGASLQFQPRFLMRWCRQNGVIVVMSRVSDYMIFLKKSA
jgi:hypothetical protein